MRVAFFASRNVQANTETLIPSDTTELLSGGRDGAETAAVRWADERGIPKMILYCDLSRCGLAASVRRHRLMIRAADLVLVVWDGRSFRERLIASFATRIGKQVWAIKPDTRVGLKRL